MMAATDESRRGTRRFRVDDVDPARVAELLRLREEERTRDRAALELHEEMLERQRQMLAACRRALGEDAYRRAIASAA